MLILELYSDQQAAAPFRTFGNLKRVTAHNGLIYVMSENMSMKVAEWDDAGHCWKTAKPDKILFRHYEVREAT